jgi:hypothetical protein
MRPNVRCAIYLGLVVSVVATTGCEGALDDSPETVAQAVFGAVASGDRAGFFAQQPRPADLEVQCPRAGKDVLARMAAELKAAQVAAAASFDACRGVARFEGARFLGVERSPAGLAFFAWPTCEEALELRSVRVLYDVGGQRRSLFVTQVAQIGGRWVSRGELRDCGSMP